MRNVVCVILNDTKGACTVNVCIYRGLVSLVASMLRRGLFFSFFLLNFVSRISDCNTGEGGGGMYVDYFGEGPAWFGWRVGCGMRRPKRGRMRTHVHCLLHTHRLCLSQACHAWVGRMRWM